MGSSVNGLGFIKGRAAEDIGLSIMQLGMITGLHAAISPSIFTFTCFAKKPEECAIAKKTLWISVAATTVTNLGTLLVFGRWAPAIVGQLVGMGLFGLGMHAIASNEEAPADPSMNPELPPKVYPIPEKVLRGIGRVRIEPQPSEMKAQDRWLDRKYADSYARWWDVSNKVENWR